MLVKTSTFSFSAKKWNSPMKLIKILTAASFSVLLGAQAHAANIVETAASTGQFNTLIAAAKAAGLAGALSGPGPLTVFAPTDAAFAKLGKATINDLLKPENKDKLAAILKYHVVSGKVNAADVPTKATLVETLNGEKVLARRNGARVRVDQARVVKADVGADNGVIHVIDRVLIPGSRKTH
jgi:uncharacterized surface protein with fasciclin (FAS1) repeats